MKIFEWVGKQFSENMINMIIYSAAILVVGWFTGPLVPGVNGVVYSLCEKYNEK